MPELSPDEVTAHTFPTSFRGFDPGEVKAYLARVAERLRMAEERADELARKLADAEDRAAHPEMDVDTLTNALGDETARILRSAQDAAADIRGKAEENVAQLLREAYEEAGRIRGEAESVLARETEAAEVAAAEVRSAAEADAAAALGRARQEAERVLVEVEAQARAMVEEAHASRTKILTDLARRRKLAHTQVEQLRAGRERLLEAYRMVRSTLDEVSDELLRAEAEARAAAEAAAKRLTEEQVEGDALDVGGDEGEADDFSVDPVAVVPQAELRPEREPTPERAPVTEAEPTAEPVAESSPEPEAPPPPPPPPPADVASAPTEAGEPMPRLAVAPPLPEPDERLSSLRIIRRPKAVEAEAPVEPAPAPDTERARAPEPEPTPPEPEPRNGFTPVAPATPGEGVRVIKADPPLPEEEPPAEEPPLVEVPVEEAPEAPPGTVDDLFARIRADRADAVAKAREVLDAPRVEAAAPPEVVTPQPDAEPEATAPTAAEPEPEPEPESEPEPEPVPDEDEALLQRRDRVVEDVELRLARRLKRALQDEQNDVLDRLRSAKGRPAVDVVLPSPGDHPERYRQVAADLLYEAARAGTAFVDAADAAVDIGDLAVGLAEDLVGPLRRRLERGLEEGADEEAALVVERVGGAYRETKGKRLEQLAADHVIAAFSRGTFLGTPEGAALRWIVDDVGGPCPDCDDNALAGPTPRGEEYPTGRLHPPAHAGCRCLLAPAGP